MTDFNVGSASYEQKVNIIDKILVDMSNKHQKLGASGFLLAGDPGVGKTSFIRFFSKLLGIDLIIIEAPHITEEHIINIPFIVFDSATDTKKLGMDQVDDKNYEVVLSKSNLVSRINSSKKVPDAAYLKNIYKSSKDMIAIFEELGGSEGKIPDEIQEIRDNFKTILFLDEFFRQTSTRIRNMLRNILNGKIGSDKIPTGTYIIYASNLNDEGLEGVALNTDFKTIEFDTPEKNDWFAYLVNKFEDDKDVKLDMKVINKFHKILEQEDLSHVDIDAEVRTSPRRWEQLLLYINASLPTKDEKDAMNLMANVKLNFKNYKTGAHSELAHKVLNAVAELIKETSDLEISASSATENSDWRSILEHQIQVKMKLGGARQYITVMSGLPGVGKTSQAAQAAADLNLRYIHIDCSTLDPEDVTGIPLSKNKGKDIETHFSEPKLYKQIMNDIKIEDRDFLADLKEEGNDDAIKEYKNAKWKYLIFFDELNRASVKTFNGIRKLLLEKSFGDGHELPAESVVVGAINPHDSGTQDMTQHMRDIIDVIDTDPSWDATVKFMKDLSFDKLENKSSKDIIFDMMNAFVDKFRVKKNTEIPQNLRHFYLNTGVTPIYISPREYSDLYVHGVTFFDRKLKRVMAKNDFSKLDSHELIAIEEKMRVYIYEVFEESLKNIMHKQDASSPEFLHNLKNWIMNSDVDIGNALFYKKTDVSDLKSIMKQYFDDPKQHLSDEMEFINYIKNTDPQRFKEDLNEFLESELGKEEDLIDKVLKKTHDKKTLTDGVRKVEKEQVSKFEHFMREIIHAFDLHNLSNEKREIIIDVVKDVINKASDNNMSDELIHFYSTLRKFIIGKLK